MAGRFEVLSNLEWKLLEDLFPEPEKKGLIFGAESICIRTP
jgi:hypothetical protein